MLVSNSDEIMRQLRDTDVVLDIGGWAHPFNRANYVMDMLPYATRGYYHRTFASDRVLPPVGGVAERFSASTWIQRDICDRTPFPFREKEIDYVICSHTLEDVRDPVWVCAEMQRIPKRGYLETPSRVIETCRGWEHPRTAGLSHHRWLVETVDDRIVFTMKCHMIHRPEFSLPSWYIGLIPEEKRYTYLFWQEALKATEQVLIGSEQTSYLSSFVNDRVRRPMLQVKCGDVCERVFLGLERRLRPLSRKVLRRRKFCSVLAVKDVAELAVSC